MNNNLERLIKQNVPFTSPQLKATIGVLYLSYCLNNAKQAEFKKYEITLQQYNILRILRGQNPRPANISLLRDRMLDKMSDASRLVNRLYKMGLVSKQPNEMDKRNADVVITEKALLLLEEIEKNDAGKPTLFHHLSENELNELNELLDKLLEHL